MIPSSASEAKRAARMLVEIRSSEFANSEKVRLALEHEVPDDEEAPAVADRLQGIVGRTVRAPVVSLHVTCMMEVITPSSLRLMQATGERTCPQPTPRSVLLTVLAYVSGELRRAGHLALRAQRAALCVDLVPEAESGLPLGFATMLVQVSWPGFSFPRWLGLARGIGRGLLFAWGLMLFLGSYIALAETVEVSGFPRCDRGRWLEASASFVQFHALRLGPRLDPLQTRGRPGGSFA